MPRKKSRPKSRKEMYINEDTCKACKGENRYTYWVNCDTCKIWYHPQCLGLKLAPIKAMKKDEKWICTSCKANSTSENHATSTVQQPESSQQQIPLRDITTSSANSSQEQDITNNDSTTMITERDEGDTTKESNDLEDIEKDSSLSENEDNYNDSDNTDLESNSSANSSSINNNDSSDKSDTINENDDSDSNTESDHENHEEDDDEHNDADEQESDTDNESIDTDNEGYAEVKEIKDWRSKGNTRYFLVVFKKNNSEEWIQESNCDGCVHLINMFCKSVGIPISKIKYKSGVGGDSNQRANKQNWADLEDAIRMARTYGEKDRIQPQRFTGLKNHDGLYLNQVGQHCFVILFLANTQTAYIADGQNIYFRDITAKKLIMSELTGARAIKNVKFYGQSEKDHCASSAAAIAIEFQRLHRIGIIPNIIQPSKGRLERIRKILHKKEGTKLNSWKPIDRNSGKIQCPNCKIHFNSKNRNVLNFHKCSK